jgi:peptidoglycan/LPS O-acetylase OafA/YrhL
MATERLGPGGSDTEHLSRLDMLRGIAVLLVLWFHWMYPIFGFDRLPWKGMWSNFSAASGTYWLFYPASLGWVAVPAFFVLSGFVIHLSTLKTVAKGATFDPFNFFWRRFWRIYPVYAVAVLAFGLGFQHGAFDILTHLLCIHNFFESTLFTISPAFWSLAAEVQFYLFYPLIAPLLLRRGVLPALKYSAFFSLFVMGITFVALDPGVKDAKLFYWWSPLITWSNWLLGAYLAERYFNKREPLRVGGGWVVVGVLLFFVSVHCRVLFPFAFHIATLLAALWIDRLARHTAPLALWERFFLGIGVISYSVYIWHHPLLAQVPLWVTGGLTSLIYPAGASGKWFPAIKMGIEILPVAAIICLLSWVSYHLIEKTGTRCGSLLWKKFVHRG